MAKKVQEKETKAEQKEKMSKKTVKKIEKTVKKTVKKILKTREKNVKKLLAAQEASPKVQKVVDLIVKTLESGKAEDVMTLNLVGKTSLADYLVIATGRAPRHVVALAEQVGLRLKKTGVKASTEGEDVGDWVIVDAGDVIVHVFTPESRGTYRIEELWGAETPEAVK